VDKEERAANEPLRSAALAVRERNRAYRRQYGREGKPAGVHPRPARTPEHYHIAYHVPADNIVIPYFQEVFETSHAVYARLKEMGQEAEPRTEWYDNGLVGIETTLAGRSGSWWVVLEACRCVRSSCRPFLSKSLRKKQMLIVPDLPEQPVVPVRGSISDLAGSPV
jgi:hypothetical protein